MKEGCKKETMSDYSFLRLLISTMVINKQEEIINKDKLERKLYDLSYEKKYGILFKYLIRKELGNITYVDLSNAFLTAYRFGLISIVNEKSEELKCLIKLNETDAKSYLEKYTQEEIYKMNELLLQLKEEQEPEYRVYTMGYLMPTNKTKKRTRKFVYIK
jgi:hypothetical protein